MKWKESYKIGVEEIDSQHKHLFDLANAAEELLLLPDHMDKYDDILHMINALKDYVVYHFHAEEALLLKIHYPKFFTHQIAHQDFIAQLHSFDVQDIDTDQTKKLLELTTLITQWLLGHVLGEDRKWAAFYLEP